MPKSIVQPIISFDDLKKAMDDYVQTVQFDEPADPTKPDGTYDPDEAWATGKKTPTKKPPAAIQV